jgi:inorganic pyrophosphatase
MYRVIALLILPGLLTACAPGDQVGPRVPEVLPSSATAALAKSVAAASSHSRHLWRDVAPLNADGTLNGYVEIPRGERRKWEFDMTTQERRLDRVMPDSLDGYPVNYGFVPQTISYDGDPFDVLVLGPPLPGGEIVRGVIVGLMRMEDEKGHDAKVVTSPVGPEGTPLFELSASDQEEMAAFFRTYKNHEPGKYSRVPGWGSAAEGLAYVRTTHTFFVHCQGRSGECRVN